MNIRGQPSAAGDPVEVEIFTAVEITWGSVTGAAYQVQWATEPDTNAWTSLGDAVEGDGTLKNAFDSTREATQRVYRVLSFF